MYKSQPRSLQLHLEKLQGDQIHFNQFSYLNLWDDSGYNLFHPNISPHTFPPIPI